MNRRNFFIKTTLAGGSIGLIPSFISGQDERKKNKDNQNVIDKVSRAMFSMQRASWEHGVAAQAMLELGNEEMVYLMAKEAVLRQTDEGRLSVVYSDNGVTDPASGGEAVLHAYNISGDEELKMGADRMLEYLLVKAPRSKEGIIYHTLNSPEIWSDAMYMSPPFLAVAGRPLESMSQIEGYRKFLWNPQHQLFSHRWHNGENKFINQRFWGGGNGWAAACYCRVIRALPDNMQVEKQKLIQYHIELLDGCLAHMREDGLFYDFVNEPNSFIELNLAQMLAYSIFRGIKGGWLNGSYLQKAELMRHAAYSKIDKYGYVQGVCGAPYFNSPGRSTEGQAFFLLMEAAYRDLNG
jgi:unsaturated rhamnogalacturonyl hydrolase